MVRENNEVRELRIEAQRQVWRVEEGAKHLKFWPPDKSRPLVIVSKTPSAKNWKRHALRDLRRSGLVWPPPK